MTHHAAWDGILEPDETIIWQGQPEAHIRWHDAMTPLAAFGAVFAGFALFWMIMASTIMGTGPGFPFTLFPLFGLPFLLGGLHMMIGHVFYDAYARSKTWYTLTDRTAFIAANVFGRKTLRSYPIRDMPFLDLEDGAPGSVLFADDRRNASHSPRRVGFRAISEARGVYGMIRDARGALNFADGRARDGT
ncbi:aspartate carbamoyltransferase catalytic subunit [Gymnodinialimonas sp. 2305UL16-5]|uniref:aspartate carbamoyltransferase catalytic subunit n=1 Tax=Gymnodinialimonas mytili TaxID=3126503 RepID=UPI0030A18A17